VGCGEVCKSTYRSLPYCHIIIRKSVQIYIVFLQGLSGIVKVSCGQRHIVALNTKNKLVAWGANNHGQCGQNSANTKHIKDPLIIEWEESNGKIVDVVSGWTHSLVLTGISCLTIYFLFKLLMPFVDRQQVYSWGRNTYGQLGRESFNDSFIPKRILDLEGITLIAAGIVSFQYMCSLGLR
jgi:alpha-tubulin suppressor-like RCC1 family protein